MPSRIKRFMMYVLILAGSSALFQLGCNAGEARLAGDQMLTGINWCFVFDCQNGALGGMIDFCAPGQELFRDCPDL